ncbi:P-loop containing nucleoside triphosphate hydrolase protein [Lipomyces oligophaga]|uniref:P-loop containing nucleoside triphosphate hydrolase protein n=1 Tax=Lipomyces oligophaga TaxID=45792 RepID=UPI0034CEEDEB
MAQLFCPSPSWDVDDFNQCIIDRYFNFWYLVIPVFFSFVSLVVSSTVRLPRFIRSRWFKTTPDYIPLDDSAADGEEIYRLNTTEDSDARISSDIDESASLLSLQFPSSSSVPAVNLNITQSLRIRKSVTILVAVILAVIHVIALIQLVAFKSPTDTKDRWLILSQTSASAFLSLYVLLLSSLNLSSRTRYNSPFLRVHDFIFYFALLFVATVNFRTSLIRSERAVSDLLAKLDFLGILTLFLICLFSPIQERPSHLEAKDGVEPNPVAFATMFEILTFSWADKIVYKGFRKALTIEDVWDLKDDCRSANLIPDYTIAKGARTMLYGLLKYFRPHLLYGFVFSVLYAIFTFTPTILVRQILRHLEDPAREPTHMAWLYVFLLLAFAIVNATCSAQALFTFRETSTRARAVIVAELYSKALRRKVAISVPDARADETAGDEVSDSAKIEDEQIDLGRVINLMAVDAFSIAEVLARLNPLIKGTMMIFISMILLYETLGPSAIAGCLGMLTLLPINYKFSRTFGKIQKELLAITDRRIQKTNEILQSIKIIKFFAWEDRFRDQLQDVRNEELAKLRTRYLILATAAMVWFGFPTIITFMTFGFYTMIAKNELTPSVAFSALSLFNIMRTPMDRLAEMITNVIEASTSVDRVQKFLDEEETQKYDQLGKLRGASDPEIGFRNASFAWGQGSSAYEFKLQDLNIVFEPGKLSVIVGPTGSGKTSILMALLGEMNILRGRVFLPGAGLVDKHVPIPGSNLVDSVAYCSQQPWLLNDTVRENILFGNKYSEQRYKHVVQLCALTRDFEILEAGDQTQVGEKGISLSGGQKQRISLARALYSPARHLLLDDCLSAVDSHTALHLYDNCITGPLMFNRTCILVSHNVALTLTLASKVIVMENGRVVAQGLPADVVASGVLGSDELLLNSIQNSRDVSRVASTVNLVEEESPNTIDEISPAAAGSAGDEGKEVVSKVTPGNAEVQQTGMVKFSVYKSYIKSLGGSTFWALVAASFFFHQTSAIAQSWWVKVWSDAMSAVETLITFAGFREPGTQTAMNISTEMFQYSATSGVQNVVMKSLPDLSVEQIISRIATGDIHGPGYYLAIYGLIAVVYIFLSFLREALFYYGSLAASKRLFDRLLSTVMRAKPRFFDSTPVGRIINRFSKDIESIDREVAVDGLSFMHSILSVLVIIGIISFIIPQFLVIGLVICVIFFLVNMFYLQSSRELKRMQSVTRSPIYQHFGETLVGVSTIRAYGYEQRFSDESMRKVDTNSRPYWLMWALNRWMCWRTDVTGGLVSFCAGVFIMISRDSIDSGLAGLILTYAITFTENMFWVVLLYASNEMNMNSVERIDEFLEIEQEADDIVPDHRPPTNWPSRGAISVSELTLRYAPELPRVIKGISFDVTPGSKIGIVGRTGAGKSTIASAFFRFLEADSGKIVIDGVDISTIGLRDLRQRLAIIPQDPTLFTGTIRTNLDPFESHSDSEIFTVLKQVHLISDLPGSTSSSSGNVEEDELAREARDMNVFYRLDSAITEGGGNLSQGQRQLMCLARSLLKAPKIIVLDEATASIDYATDAEIQETIRREFGNSTILTIAHRLKTIIDYDKILVLDGGLIKEYDSPHALLQIPDSIFKSMCESSGELETLEDLARQAYAKKN